MVLALGDLEADGSLEFRASLVYKVSPGQSEVHKKLFQETKLNKTTTTPPRPPNPQTQRTKTKTRNPKTKLLELMHS